MFYKIHIYVEFEIHLKFLMLITLSNPIHSNHIFLYEQNRLQILVFRFYQIQFIRDLELQYKHIRGKFILFFSYNISNN